MLPLTAATSCLASFLCCAGGLLARDEINPVLNGTLPGDYGYDPLGLAKDAETLAKYRANELLHARWAMLAAAGAIIPEGLAANGADVKGATWFETGAAMLNGGTLNWFAVPFVNFNNPLPLFAVVAINVALMAAAENYRRTGEPYRGSSGWGAEVQHACQWCSSSSGAVGRRVRQRVLPACVFPPCGSLPLTLWQHAPALPPILQRTVPLATPRVWASSTSLCTPTWTTCTPVSAGEGWRKCCSKAGSSCN